MPIRWNRHVLAATELDSRVVGSSVLPPQTQNDPETEQRQRGRATLPIEVLAEPDVAVLCICCTQAERPRRLRNVISADRHLDLHVQDMPNVLASAMVWPHKPRSHDV
jgi:hypothetical protein